MKQKIKKKSIFLNNYISPKAVPTYVHGSHHKVCYYCVRYNPIDKILPTFSNMPILGIRLQKYFITVSSNNINMEYPSNLS
jgi:hypothetical protein